MNREDIIRMAREAGFEKYESSSLSGQSKLDRTLQVGEYPVGESVFKFAALVAAAEREACAKVAEAIEKDRFDAVGDPRVSEFKSHIATAIRARGQE